MTYYFEVFGHEIPARLGGKIQAMEFYLDAVVRGECDARRACDDLNLPGDVDPKDVLTAIGTLLAALREVGDLDLARTFPRRGKAQGVLPRGGGSGTLDQATQRRNAEADRAHRNRSVIATLKRRPK